MLERLALRHVVLCITGGIAAYKGAELVRRLRDRGAEVRVVMTAAAQQFITPLTLQALSGNPVHTELLDPEAEAGMGHIELARWADLVLVAPASADALARLATGMANDLMTTLWLATKARRAVAPAMNQAMWSAEATQRNLAVLKEAGVDILGPASGAQACGDMGLGRMLEAEELALEASSLFEGRLLDGVRVVLTAGPTREALDPVRYLSNHSTGKMGYSLAKAFCDQGARVVLISGPVNLRTPEGVIRQDVVSAEEMLQATLVAVSGCDIFVATAAVADYRVADVATQKIKKTADEMILRLVKNPDIVATVAALPQRPFVVGFAAETENLETYAQSKLVKKNLDMIACNDVSRTDIGFGAEDNDVTVFWPGGQSRLEKASKAQIAEQMVAIIAKHWKMNQSKS